ncbi:MAG: hypothetical protein O2979_12415 [Proteobacteria bacterium]|nr:hypothetical protein [Pseudomonadota bacterium]
MISKIVAGIIAAALLIVFVGPVVIKLKDVALSVVVLIGLTMMIVDIWHDMRTKDD